MINHFTKCFHRSIFNMFSCILTMYVPKIKAFKLIDENNNYNCYKNTKIYFDKAIKYMIN